MTRKLGHLVIALGLTLPSWCADKSASITGYVHTSGGAPQVGAIVEVLGTAPQVFKLITDEKGLFNATGLVPGIYSVKVSAPAFLPTLREKISLKAGASVLLNLTLSTVFDALQCTPRRGTAEDGDWDWVLRSTASRRVLRILPDGSPVMVADKSSSSDLKGSLSFVAGASSQGFGSISDMSTGFTVEKSVFASGTLSFNGNVGYGPALPNAVLRSSYKHRMANGSTPEIAFTMRRLSSPDLGIHNQDLALSHREGNTRMQVAYSSDRLGNPALIGVGDFSSRIGDVLPDVYSVTFTYEGRNLDTNGLRLVLNRQLTPNITATAD